ATALLQLGGSECSQFFQIAPAAVEHFRWTMSGVSTLNGTGKGASADLPSEVGPLSFDLFRSSGTGAASARLDLWHTAQLTLAGGATATLGIGPFQMHGDVHVLNMGARTARFRVTSRLGGPPTDHLLGPGAELVLPQESSPTPVASYTLQVGNPDIAPTPIELAVEIVYGFDLVGLGGPDTRPAFSASLQSSG